MKITQGIALFLLAAFFGFGIYACKKNRFRKDDFLTEFYTMKIQPELAQAVNEGGLVNTDWATYKITESEADLSNFRADFRTWMQTIERIAFYNLGDVSATYIYNRVYKTKIDVEGIKNRYVDEMTFTKGDIAGYANTEKGIYALEYLLFDSEWADSVGQPKFQSFIAAQLNYAEGVVTDIAGSWVVYEKNFLKKTEGGVTDSYNIVINRIIHVLEDIVLKKIEVPLDANDPELAVGYLSETAWLSIKERVVHLQTVYNGVGPQGEFNSVYNHVRKKNKKLANEINDLFNEAIVLGNALNHPFTYLLENNKTDMERYNAILRTIIVKFKEDVQKELEIVITFGDTDGD